MTVPDREFEFVSYNYDLITGKWSFRYQITLENGKKLNFTETLYFPSSDLAFQIPTHLLSTIGLSLHLILGVSYWKLYCPPILRLRYTKLSKTQANFWNTVYRSGLGEFFYRNKIDFTNLINFPFHTDFFPNQLALLNRLPLNRCLVGFGGGKDSILVTEILKTRRIPFDCFIVEIGKHNNFIDKIITTAGVKILQVRRVLDQQLLSYQSLPGSTSGHVPISAINAFIGITLALLHNYRYVIVGNEHSADSGNIEWKDLTVNHQWSKSVEFEKLFQDYLSNFISQNVSYFSLLRPWYEIKITKKFTKYPQYFLLFTSCNSNYRIIKTSKKSTSLWCGRCAKCAFIFILLSAFLSRRQVCQIFQKNLLADLSLWAIFRQLLGVEGIKPFDCVGTVEEVLVAFELLSEKGEFADSPIVREYLKKFRPLPSKNQDLKKLVFSDFDMSLMPKKFQQIISAI